MFSENYTQMHTRDGWKQNGENSNKPYFLFHCITACYIDVDLEDDILDPNHRFSQWHQLPNLLLEEIFSYLDVRERYYASLVSLIATNSIDPHTPTAFHPLPPSGLSPLVLVHLPAARLVYVYRRRPHPDSTTVQLLFRMATHARPLAYPVLLAPGGEVYQRTRLPAPAQLQQPVSIYDARLVVHWTGKSWISI